jgi:hypothetical protein
VRDGGNAIGGNVARMRCGVLAAILWATVAACSGSGEVAPDAFAFGERCEPGGTFDMNGRAAVLGTLNVHINASGLVETDTTAELLIAMDVVQEGRDVTVSAKACAIEIPDVPISGQDQPISFEVPEATIDSVAEIAGVGTLSSPNETCATFATEELVIVLGAKLDDANVATAPLPSADEDGNFETCPLGEMSCELAIGSGCACDQEGDLNPGATLLAMNVPAVNLDQIYVTLRTRFSLSGEVYSSDKVLGTIDATLEQGILGCRMADGDMCSAAEVNTVKVLNPQITQLEGNPSLFQAARVPEGTTCADIIAMRDTLFPR